MERKIDIMIYLLTRLVAIQDGVPYQMVANEIEDKFPKAKRTRTESEETDNDAVNRIYAIYPTKCPVSQRNTGKCSKDKDRIARLLKTTTEEKLSSTIKRYIDDCIKQNSYIKNFSTFLNNIPDTEETIFHEDETDPFVELSGDPEAAAYIEQRRKLYQQ